MATDVVMPQMGESIAEGTIVRWIKKVGDRVDRDEPLFEISTDKVDAEIPAPAAGVVSEIRVREGETVPVNSIVAVIGSATAAGGEGGAHPGEGTILKVPAAAAAQPGEARPAPLDETRSPEPAAAVTRGGGKVPGPEAGPVLPAGPGGAGSTARGDAKAEAVEV